LNFVLLGNRKTDVLEFNTMKCSNIVERFESNMVLKDSNCCDPRDYFGRTGINHNIANFKWEWEWNPKYWV